MWKNREMLFSFGRTCTNGCRSVRWNAWANTCCVAGNVAVSAAIVPAATFTHFNATYVILRAAARRVRAPIRLGDTVHRWITLGGTWLLPRWLTLWTNRIPFQSSLPATWQGPFRDHRVRWTRAMPGPPFGRRGRRGQIRCGGFVFLVSSRRR